jgi:hypothetical protein
VEYTAGSMLHDVQTKNKISDLDGNNAPRLVVSRLDNTYAFGAETTKKI